jgi:hypothetical protein
MQCAVQKLFISLDFTLIFVHESTRSLNLVDFYMVPTKFTTHIMLHEKLYIPTLTNP